MKKRSADAARMNAVVVGLTIALVSASCGRITDRSPVAHRTIEHAGSTRDINEQVRSFASRNGYATFPSTAPDMYAVELAKDDVTMFFSQNMDKREVIDVYFYDNSPSSTHDIKAAERDFDDFMR